MSPEQEEQLEAGNIAWEARLSAYCHEAKLDALQTELVLSFLLDGLTVRQTRRLRKLNQRMSELQRALSIGLAKLSGVEGFQEASRQFGRDLLTCILNKCDAPDVRPAGVCGVTPARASQRFQGARQVLPPDVSRRQPLEASAKLWAQQERPALVR